MNSIGLQSYREEKDSGRKSVDEERYLVQSRSEQLNSKYSDSAISLRISVLSNKSEDVNCYKTNIDIYKLQRTKDINRLSSLIVDDLLQERKNQSETFYVGNVFKRLLEEDAIDYTKHQLPAPENVQKIFEYKPQEEDAWDASESKDNTQNIKTQEMLNLDLPNNEQFDDQEQFHDEMVIVQNKLSEKDDSSSDFQPIHHMKTSSNENFGVKKVEDMSIEQLLLGDDQEELSQHDAFDSIENQFSKQIDPNFIENIHNETQTPISDDLPPPEDEIYSDVCKSDNIEEAKEFSSQLMEDNIDLSYDGSSKAESEENNDFIKPHVPQLKIEEIEENDELNHATYTPPVQNSSFSPQNLVTKLLNSLNKNSSQSQKSNVMLIRDDVETPVMNDMMVGPDSEQNEFEVDQEGDHECVQPSPVIEIKPKSQVDHTNQIADLLTDQLLLEIKESMFPQRQTPDQYLDINDPTS